MTWDEVAGGRRPGGSVLYSSSVYAELGHDVCVLGHVDSDQAIDRRVEVIKVGRKVPVFENLYDPNGARRQRVLAEGGVIESGVDPDGFDLIHLAPVLDEVRLGDWTEISQFVVAGLQGWLRHIEDGQVRPARWGARPMPFDLAALSTEDIQGLDEKLVERLRDEVEFVGLTDGARGATLFGYECEYREQGWPTPVEDPTGAGDVFCAALAHALFACEWQPARALRYACRAGAIVVSGQGREALERLDEKLEAGDE